MKSLIFIANWKSYKTSEEAIEWFQVFTKRYAPTEHQIILAVSYTLLPILKPLIATRQDMALATQDLSEFSQGAHTAEIAAEQAVEYVTYCLIGHSEVRRETGETLEQRKSKIELAEKNGIIPFVFYEGDDDALISSPFLVFEPPSAISPNPPESPEKVRTVTEQMKKEVPSVAILYGGSVTAQDVSSYTSLPLVSGVVVGHASLNPNEFVELITHA